MNAYQRVMSTLSGAPADRPPVFAVLGAYGANLTGCSLRTLYSDAEAYLEAQRALQKAFGFDLVLAPFDFSAIAEAFGGETAWSELQPPNVRRPAAADAARALALPMPDPRKTGRLPVALEATRRLAGDYKEKVPVVSVLPGPGTMPALMMGLEQWMETLLFDPQAAAVLLARSGDFLVDFANALLSAGADCLVFTEGMASAEVAPRQLFAASILPHLKEIFPRINGPKVISSTGGRINQVLDLLPPLRGVVAVITGSRDDLGESRRMLGPEITLIGNLDNLCFASIGAAEIGEMSLACLGGAATCGRFILANAGGDIPLATPAGNLLAMRAAVEGYQVARSCR